MRPRKRTLVTTVTREILVVRRNAKAGQFFWCDACQRQAEWLSLTETARLSGITLKEIFRLIEAGVIHFRESAEGQTFACANSLVAAVRI